MNEDNIDNDLESREIKNQFKFYKEEFIALKKSKNEELTKNTIANFRDVLEIIALTYRQQGMLNVHLGSLANFFFNSYRLDGNYTDKELKYLEKLYDSLIDSLDLHIRSPNTLHYVTKKIKRNNESNVKKILQKVFGLKRSETIDSSQSIPIERNIVIKPNIVLDELNSLLIELNKLKTINVKETGRHPLLEIHSKLSGMIKILDSDGNDRSDELAQRYKKFQSFEKSERLFKLNQRHIEEYLFREYAEWLERRIKQFISEFSMSKKLLDESNEEIFNSSEISKIYKTLETKFKDAKYEVFIVDSWIDETIFELFFDSIDKTVPIKILTQNPSKKCCILGKQISKTRHLEIKTDPNVHDRMIFVDNKCWILGQSIKDAGVKPTTIVPFNNVKSLYNIWMPIFNKSSNAL